MDRLITMGDPGVGRPWRQRLAWMKPALAGLVALAVSASPVTKASAQFLYLDTNGDALSSSADVLNSTGEPTPISVYLDTSRDPDGSAAFCRNGRESLTFSSYEFILHAIGGTVTFGSYTNLRRTMTTSLGTGSSATDFHVGFGGSTMLPPGLYQLGALTVTVATGSPTLNPAASTPLRASAGTRFGTECSGRDSDNTYKLGLDWHGIAGCGPQSGRHPAPAVVVPALADVEIGKPVDLIGEFSGLSPTDTLSVAVTGLPPGLKAVSGWQADGRKQVRIYGYLGAGVPAGVTYDVAWSASDGAVTQVTHTTIRAKHVDVNPDELQARVADLVTTNYIHGMPNSKIRALGSAALPILAQMLRQEEYKGHVIKIVDAIGVIGDTAYFDTLRAFVWDRFRGPIGQGTFMAIRSAQSSLSAIATISPRALEYLIATSTPLAWASTPWSFSRYSNSVISELLVDDTLIALGYTDSERASEVIRSVPISAERLQAIIDRGLHNVHERVRTKGYVQELADQEAHQSGRSR